MYIIIITWRIVLIYYTRCKEEKLRKIYIVVSTIMEVRHMVTRDRQNINGIRLNVWRRRILQERFARNRSIITTWANFEATGKLFTLSWLPLRIIAELSAAMWNAAVIYSAWQRIVQSAAYKLNSVTKRKKKKKKSRFVAKTVISSNDPRDD